MQRSYNKNSHLQEFCNLSKHLTSIFIQKRLIFSVQSRFISVSPVLVPTNQQIAHLILEQKTASQALQTFKWASEISNFTHTPSTYRALIHKLCTFRQFETVEQLLEEMPKSIGSGPDDDIFITMVRGYGRARMIREVTRVLDLLPKFGKAPSLKLLNSILDVLAKEDIDIAREFYRKKIMGSGLKGDDYTYGILMKGFCLTNRIGDGFKLLRVMKTRGVKINVVVYNTLIYALCKNGKVGRARSLMSEMEDYSDVTFNIMISAYCNENNLVPALVLMEKCFGNGFLPDVVSVTKVVKVLCNAGRVLDAAEVLQRVEGKGGTLDVVAHNTLIEGFVRAGKVRAGLGFLKQMEMKGCLPNTDTYNILIASFCESGMLDSALDMFHEMKRAGVKWDFATFETLIHGLCSNGRTREGLRIFELIEEGKGSFLGRINPYNSILYGLYRENLITEALEFLKNMRNLFPTAVDMSSRILRLCHDGHTVEAKKVFEEMTAAGRCPSALIHASLIQGFCEKGCIKEAVELMNQMMGLGYFPIASTFNGLINGLCEQRKTTRALRLVEDLKMRGFLPDSESYGLLINAFCSEGEPQKALMLFLEMVGRGLTPDYNSWNVIIPAVSEFRDHKLLQQLT
ncbi:LOW QUALITY PROTEIN: pentatricopeptide repeat-containing protein At2g17525, mitochondrial [Primulina tabacum]|uniref:LOW QUALITY PROTEIN: pentatricopeptide repeat-containing protein At2g17525, mitochondrial n=1 Tax=Primulina tabacum TaxID=48773 RepID=UPI003F5ABFB9